MSIVAQDVFAERIGRYIERNPDASTPEVLGQYLAEPTDEHVEFVEAMLSGDDEAEPPQPSGESDGTGGLA